MTPEIAKQNAAAVEAFLSGKSVECKHADREDLWEENQQPLWIFDRFQYRPKPEPVFAPWSKPEHVPLNCWIRHKSAIPIYCITSISDSGIVMGGEMSADWSHLERFEWSTGCVTWKPCTVTE